MTIQWGEDVISKAIDLAVTLYGAADNETFDIASFSRAMMQLASSCCNSNPRYLYLVDLDLDLDGHLVRAILSGRADVVMHGPENSYFRRVKQTKQANEQTAWPLPMLVWRLANAVDHLLHDHDCDAHGHEGLLYALRAARSWLDEQPAGSVPGPHYRAGTDCHAEPATDADERAKPANVSGELAALRLVADAARSSRKGNPELQDALDALDAVRVSEVPQFDVATIEACAIAVECLQWPADALDAGRELLNSGFRTAAQSIRFLAPNADAETRLRMLRNLLPDECSDQRKYYRKARVYGAIAAEYQRALERIVNMVPIANMVPNMMAIAREALAWRHSESGGVPRRAIDEIGSLLAGNAKT